MKNYLISKEFQMFVLDRYLWDATNVHGDIPELRNHLANQHFVVHNTVASATEILLYGEDLRSDGSCHEEVRYAVRYVNIPSMMVVFNKPIEVLTEAYANFISQHSGLRMTRGEL